MPGAFFIHFRDALACAFAVLVDGAGRIDEALGQLVDRPTVAGSGDVPYRCPRHWDAAGNTEPLVVISTERKAASESSYGEGIRSRNARRGQPKS
jgi:hypothetical protein